MNPLLQKKRFISTRPKDSSGELTDLLKSEGATVDELPLIEIKAAHLSEKEKGCLTRLSSFQWILFTSSNGIKFFFEYLEKQTGSNRLPEELQIAVIGNKTEQTLNSFGYKASFVNPGSTAEDFTVPFARLIEKENVKPNLLLPLGNLARTYIQDQLKDTATCIRINVYQTGMPEQVDMKLIQQIEEDNYDMVIFTSPSGIQNFLASSPSSRDKNIRMACIGPVTRREANKNGFQPLVTSEISSAAGIVQSIINYYISKTEKYI